MKTRDKLIVTAAVVVLVGIVGTFGYLTVSMLDHAGDDAVAQMNTEERESLRRVEQLSRSMKPAEVCAILGEPTSGVLGLAKWDGFGGSSLSQLRIYFFDGQPRKLRWMKLGYFVYEKNL
jgi:hypothetical protein